jgi:hypothetical protein
LHQLYRLNARKGESYIREYIEQIYVDKFASINEKFIYKKNRDKLPAYQVSNYLTVGHEPTFKGHLPILSNDSKKLLCDILNPIIN